MYRFCEKFCLAEVRESFTLNQLREIGYLDFIKKRGYTPLVFGDGRLVFLPVSALPPGIAEGDNVELTLRRVEDE